MAKRLSLLKPEVKHKYLKNKASERVEYIDVQDKNCDMLLLTENRQPYFNGKGKRLEKGIH